LQFAADGEARVFEAEADDPAAWQSRGYGEKSPSRCIVYQARPAAKVRYCTFVGRPSYPVSFNFDHCEWSIEKPTGHVRVVCDPQHRPDGDGWQELHGEGAWPVFVMVAKDQFAPDNCETIS